MLFLLLSISSTFAQRHNTIYDDSYWESWLNDGYIDSMVHANRHRTGDTLGAAPRFPSYGEQQWKLSDDQYRSLSPQQKVIYALGYPESFSQSCSIYLRDTAPTIHGNWPRHDAFTYSFRQSYDLNIYQPLLLNLLIQFVDTSKGVPDKYLKIISEKGIRQAIPGIVEHYKKHPRMNYLTTLLILLKDGKFQPFINSELYSQIYMKTENSFSDGISFDPALGNEIVSFAQQYYEERLKNK